jgi:hypothetical protein
MTTRPPRPGRPRRRPAARPGPVDLLWATVLRRFRDHVHGTRTDTGTDTATDTVPRPDPDREDRR